MNTLSVAGVMITTVCDVYDFGITLESDKSYNDTLNRLYKFVKRENGLADKNTEEACRVWTGVFGAAVIADLWDPPRDEYWDLSGLTSLFLWLQSNDTVPVVDQLPDTRWKDKIGQLLRCILGHGAFTDSQRPPAHCGLVPRSSQNGDIICVILGCNMPMVLRPHGNGRFTLVGQCFVSHIPFGDAVLGPFSDITQAYIRTEANACNLFVFKNNDTGTVAVADPRLERFPGFEEYREELRDNPWRKFKIHPQLLRDEGVNIQYFNIV
ncbi:hypothetical protein BKA67DRAFT_540600 [Truncatella angustata]|uniref:Uncharacterized protein n=1 Tax=Truncatella angustata TaxID=152316 RepID=A0A9P8UCA2_9PEZI|nr:uncharacterized protein BKA67DRAFT_540600 [Truncatella angustata]KAH6647147.1 hypothetical protein BKA67DRAFT_540600 [Truncatella angustata]